MMLKGTHFIHFFHICTQQGFGHIYNRILIQPYPLNRIVTRVRQNGKSSILPELLGGKMS